MQYLKTAKAGDTSQGALSAHVNYLKSPEGGRAKMGEFEKYFTEQGEAQGKLKERNKIILNMLHKKKALSDILDITEASKDDVYAVAKENGLEVVGG